MINALLNFKNDESGASAVEYGIIAAFMGLALVSTLLGLRDSLASGFLYAGESVVNGN